MAASEKSKACSPGCIDVMIQRHLRPNGMLPTSPLSRTETSRSGATMHGFRAKPNVTRDRRSFSMSGHLNYELEHCSRGINTARKNQTPGQKYDNNRGKRPALKVGNKHRLGNSQQATLHKITSTTTTPAPYYIYRARLWRKLPKIRNLKIHMM